MIVTVTLNAAIDKRYVLERFQEGHVNRVRECVYTPGGKGLNVARTIAALGGYVCATGLTGGYAGAYIEKELKKYGVESQFYRVEAESRSCINLWDAAGRRQTEILEPGFEVTPEDFEGFMALYSGLVERASVISISGSLPKGLDGRAYAPLIRMGKEKGKRVILDTSGLPLKEAIEAAPFLIKPNLDEIRDLTGNPCETLEEIKDAARAVYAKGIENVVVSLGEKGALMVCSQGIFRAEVPKISAVNTVGCGDAMTAGFAMGLCQGLSPEELLKSASAVSAAAAMTEETGTLSPEAAEELLPKISVIRETIKNQEGCI